jgi:single-strand DNA-binding protein
MASFNKVILVGNLTKDPEVRYVPSGTAVGDMRMAVSRKYKGADGQEHEDTCFVTVTVWGRQAETCGEYLRKGSPLLVEGRLKMDEWEKDGQKMSRLGVVGERVQFLGGGSGGGGGAPRNQEFVDRTPAAAPAAASPAPAAAAAPTPTPAPAAPPPEPVGDDDNLPF